VFLETRGNAAWTVGMTQGKLRVTVDNQGMRHVAAALGDVAFTRSSGAATQAVSQPKRLDDFEREVRAYVKGAQ
jgi:hypothetical protein